MKTIVRPIAQIGRKECLKCGRTQLIYSKQPAENRCAVCRSSKMRMITEAGTLHCNQCKAEWTPRVASPRHCPNCGSRRWYK